MIYNSEELHTIDDTQDVKVRRISFTFDPRLYEMVRAKDGAYIVRKRRAKEEMIIDAG